MIERATYETQSWCSQLTSVVYLYSRIDMFLAPSHPSSIRFSVLLVLYLFVFLFVLCIKVAHLPLLAMGKSISVAKEREWNATYSAVQETCATVITLKVSNCVK